MTIIKQLVSFMLGIAIGVCLYSLLKLRPLTPARWTNGSSPVGTNNKSLRPPWVQRSLLPPVARPRRVLSAKRVHAVAREVAEVRSPVQAKPETVRVAEPFVAREGVVENISSPPPSPTIFKAMGYVEEAGGKLEAIIVQENQAQVVHVGDLIAGRYRVTKVSHDSVEALDVTLVQSPMAKPDGSKSNELMATAGQGASTPPVAIAAPPPPGSRVAREGDDVADVQSAGSISSVPAVIAQAQPPAPSRPAMEDRGAPPQSEEPVTNSVGFVQKADGKIEAVVAEGDTIRMVPETTTATLAQAAASPPSQVEASPAPVSTQAEAPPAPAPAPLPAMTAATGESMAATAVEPEGSTNLAMASLDRQTSYEVSSPAPVAADGAASDSLALVSAGGAAEALDRTVDQAATTFAENHRVATMAMATRGQDGRATQSGGSTVRAAKLPVEMKPLGFVVKGNGELAAILSKDDEVYIVRQGDRFAGRYRAVGVSADAVEAVEEPLRHGQDAPATSSATGVPPVSDHGQDGHATFVFQTLGYVETQGGERQAIVADGSQLYLVTQGETFAGQYRATSVDPTLVLAEGVSPEQKVGPPLASQTEPGGKPASKKLYGYLHYPLLGWANAGFLHEVDASGSPVLTNLGMNLLNSSLTGFDLQSLFFTADNPHVAF